MKKVLEGELISLAHSILKLKNRADIFELKDKAQALHEKLTVLAYAEKHFEGPQPTLSKREFVAYVEEEINIEEATGEVEEAPHVTENRTEKNDDETKEQAEISKESEQETTPTETTPLAEASQTPAETIPVEVENVAPKEVSSSKIEEDFGVHFDQLPQFEPLIRDEKSNETPKTDEIEEAATPTNEASTKEEAPQEKPTEEVAESKEDDLPEAKEEEQKEVIEVTQEKVKEVSDSEVTKASPQKTMDLFSQDKKSLNDQLRKGIKIGLNDRLAFTKHLFNNNVADYNRVLSQLNTLSSPAEAMSFINDTVKPSYEYWENKEEFEARFITAVVARFE